MTKISYIHGVPANEYAHRGQAATIGQAPYVPYLSLTQGEMRLQLLRQRMLLFSRFYPEATEYSTAVAMIDNALTAGVHRGVNFIGAIPDELQQVAQVIASAVEMTRPASSGIIVGRESVMNGVGEIIRTADSTKRLNECIKIVNSNAKYNTSKEVREGNLRRCQTLFEIERLYNDYLERIGHHTVYNRLSANYSGFTARVDTKRLLHDAGIEGMGNAAEINKLLVSDWVENGVLAKNASIGAGLLSSTETSFVLAPEPDAQFAKYHQWLTGSKKDKIGIAPAVIGLIVTAIASVVVAAFQFLTEIQKQKAYAMSEARGFGTSAFAADQSDWLTKQTLPGSEKDNTMMYLAMGVGAYFLLNDD